MSLMYVGAAVGVVKGVVDGLTTHSVLFYTSSSTSSGTTVHDTSSPVAAIITAIIYGGLWLWMAWKTRAGRNWARVLSSVFFGFACLQLIGGITSLAGSGDPVPAFIVSLVEWGVGLAALIQLWQRESSAFFAFAKQAKLAAGYAATYSGNQPPATASHHSSMGSRSRMASRVMVSRPSKQRPHSALSAVMP